MTEQALCGLCDRFCTVFGPMVFRPLFSALPGVRYFHCRVNLAYTRRLSSGSIADCTKLLGPSWGSPLTGRRAQRLNLFHPGRLPVSKVQRMNQQQLEIHRVLRRLALSSGKVSSNIPCYHPVTGKSNDGRNGRNHPRRARCYRTQPPD